VAPSGGGASHRCGEVAAELLGEVDRDAGVDSALAIEEFRMVVEGYDRAVPDVAMN